MANYKQTRKTGGNVILKAIVAVLLVGVLAAGVCCCGYASRNDAGAWFGNSDFSTWHWSDKSPNDDENNDPATAKKYVDGMVTTVSSASKMRLASRAMTAAATAKTDSQYMLTATVDPDDADDQTLEWLVAFQDPNSEWASGKNPTDYVTVTPTSDTKNAHVSCLAPFGEQIIVTAKSVDNPEAYATCTCDYFMRAQSLVFEFGDGGFENISYTYSLEGTAHTIESELKITSMTMELRDYKYNSSDNFMYVIKDKLPALFSAAGLSSTGLEFITTKQASLIINQEANTVSLPNGKTDVLFDLYDGYTEDDSWWDWSDSQKTTAYNCLAQAFRQAVKEYTGYHAHVSISYQLTYNGENYSSGTVGGNFNFNYQTIKVGVNSVNLNISEIIF